MLKILLTINIIITSNYATAQTLEECVSACNEVIEAADLHINKLNDLIKSKDLYIQYQDSQLQETRAALLEEINENTKWYKNPAITITLGVVAGLITGVLVTND